MTRKDIIAVIGYGSQGRAIALNLRDSGYSVTVGLRRASPSRRLAKSDSCPVDSIDRAIGSADYIVVAVPDHVQPRLLKEEFFGQLPRKASLIFLHASSIHFRTVVPPPDIPVLLFAPHAPGQEVRDNYLHKRAFSAFVAVHQGSKKRGLADLKRFAAAVGVPGGQLVKTTFAAEAVGDIFGEQAVLCGGLARLLKFGFEVLVENGLPPRNAYLEVAYQIDLIVKLIKEHGLEGMFERISPLARYGSVVNGPRVIPREVKKEMSRILAEIESGRFIDQALRRNMAYSRPALKEVTNRQFDRQAQKMGRKKVK